MIRKGEYTIYNGREYRFIESDTVEAIELISNDKKVMENGFTYYKKNIYTKIVGVNEVKELYSINPYAVYKEEVFPASQERKTGKVLLATTNTELAKRMGFERTDKYMYSKSVEWDEVEIIEERKPYSLD
ncbi:hypothetical protein ACPOM7_14420 [Peribacillus castrilensis]|uniref:Uncharacterized protein n=1 Tax=Peribacillus simplex TaxID=1478 RepID=A0AAN2TR06_9BACI|nr:MULTISPECIES: hypothetical protein [Peribacillus]MCP1151301.1 hypothetical protein [Peribacillus frigoritolerans]MCT1388959.1 hypothetical protein [Peribacillus frigoritolerans]NCT35520.1 hypothetical protein [Peribacillus frigoritolerans]CEG30583.1 Hypothetical protein BN1180_00694 [Peribacillus simplex]